MKIYFLGLAFLLASCGPNYRGVRGDVSFVDFPDSGEITSVNIGDTLLSKAKVETREGFRLNSPITAPFALEKLQFSTGDYYLRTETKSHQQFYPVDNKMVFSGGVDFNGRVGFAIRKKDNKITGWTIGGVHMNLDQVPSITKKTVTLINTTNFKQELIYNGKSGNIARFLYREYSGNLARPAFTQELTYDLASSRVIGFKEVRLEVLRTTNTSIQYRVISGFKSRD
jgi:hypothetical protein